MWQLYIAHDIRAGHHRVLSQECIHPKRCALLQRYTIRESGDTILCRLHCPMRNLAHQQQHTAQQKTGKTHTVCKFRRYPLRLCPNYQNLFVIYPLSNVNNPTVFDISLNKMPAVFSYSLNDTFLMLPFLNALWTASPRPRDSLLSRYIPLLTSLF